MFNQIFAPNSFDQGVLRRLGVMNQIRTSNWIIGFNIFNQIQPNMILHVETKQLAILLIKLIILVLLFKFVTISIKNLKHCNPLFLSWWDLNQQLLGKSANLSSALPGKGNFENGKGLKTF